MDNKPLNKVVSAVEAAVQRVLIRFNLKKKRLFLVVKLNLRIYFSN